MTNRLAEHRALRRYRKAAAKAPAGSRMDRYRDRAVARYLAVVSRSMGPG
jgi:hypothetical protein